jgi:Tol biopolymer transport system component/DNA-binding winged helix-turn-helix (wHTH) protein
MSNQQVRDFGMDGFPTSFRLGDHLVQSNMNCISSDGVEIRVEPKVMDLLVYLAARSGEVCSREELLENVWKYSAVGEEALTTAVSKLRRALKDDSKNPRHLQTISRRGYRLVSDAPLDLTLYTASGDSNGDGLTSKWGDHLKRIWLVAAPLTIIALAWSMIADPSRPRVLDASVSPPYRVTPLTSYAGVESEPAISPDGTKVAFVWNDPGRGVSDIYIKQTSAEAPFRLTHDDANNASPVWSPDGTEVAYVNNSESGDQIMVIPAIGGDARRLVQTSGSVGRIDWAPDGETIACAVRPRAGLSARITVYNLSTGLGTELTSPELSSDDDVNPRYSPDGKLIAFVRRCCRVRDDVCVVASDGSSPRRVVSSLTRVHGHDWSRDGGSITCVGVLGGIDATWRLDLDTSMLTWVPGIQQGARDISLARSSPRMVYSQHRDDTNVKRVQWGTPPVVDNVASSSYADDYPAISPDGKRIALVSNRSGSPQVWIADLEGGHARQLTAFDGCFVAFPCWSPDMEQIVFAASPSGDMGVFIVRVDEEASARRVVGGVNVRPTGWSNDGESIYVAMADIEGWAIWRIYADEPDWRSNAVQMAANGAFFGQESLDGRHFYFSKHGQPGLWRTPLGEADSVAGAERVLERFPQRGGSWSLCERGVIGTDDIDGGEVLVCHALAEEVVHKISDVGRRLTGAVSASRDGSTVVYSLCENESGDLMLIEEF